MLSQEALSYSKQIIARKSNTITELLEEHESTRIASGRSMLMLSMFLKAGTDIIDAKTELERNYDGMSCSVCYNYFTAYSGGLD
jgi:hypothetical protein